MSVPRLGLALVAGLTVSLSVPVAAATAAPAAPQAVVKKKKSKKSGKQARKVKAPRKDWDRDGLNNRYERKARTKPRVPDSDRDGVRDGAEDRDRDGVDNWTEQRALTRPGRADSDRDGTPDGAEDPDRDGLNNAGESQTGMHPRKPDSDRDGVRDGAEHAGWIKAFVGDAVTISLAGGGELSGRVTDESDVFCAADDGTGDDYVDEEAEEEFGPGEPVTLEELGDYNEDGVVDAQDLVDFETDEAYEEDEFDEDFEDEEWLDEDEEGLDEDDEDLDRRSARLAPRSTFTTCLTPGARVYQADITRSGLFVTIDLLGG